MSQRCNYRNAICHVIWGISRKLRAYKDSHHDVYRHIHHTHLMHSISPMSFSFLRLAEAPVIRSVAFLPHFSWCQCFVCSAMLNVQFIRAYFAFIGPKHAPALIKSTKMRKIPFNEHFSSPHTILPSLLHDWEIEEVMVGSLELPKWRIPHSMQCLKLSELEIKIKKVDWGCAQSCTCVPGLIFSKD